MAAELQPQFGAIARCSNGEKGLITSPAPVEVSYEDGTTGMAWTGYNISPARIGQPWSSRNPLVLQRTGAATTLIFQSLIGRVRRQKRLV